MSLRILSRLVFVLAIGLSLSMPEQAAADCPEGMEADLLDISQCYQCPEGYSRDIIQPLTSDLACFKEGLETAPNWVYALEDTTAPNWVWATGAAGGNCPTGDKSRDPWSDYPHAKTLFEGRCFGCPAGFERDGFKSWYSASACRRKNGNCPTGDKSRKPWNDYPHAKTLFEGRCFGCQPGTNKNILESWYDHDSCEGNWVSKPEKTATNTCGGGGDRACTLLERIPACDYPYANNNGRCDRICGQEDQAACGLTQRTPACDTYLGENKDGICVHPDCGREEQRACPITDRLPPSCDSGLIEDNGICWKNLDCGGPFERACLTWERIPSCNPGLSEHAMKGVCIPTNGFNSQSDAQCDAVFSQNRANEAQSQQLTKTFGTGAKVEFGLNGILAPVWEDLLDLYFGLIGWTLPENATGTASTEQGVAYSADGDFACFVTTCRSNFAAGAAAGTFLFRSDFYNWDGFTNSTTFEQKGLLPIGYKGFAPNYNWIEYYNRTEKVGEGNTWSLEFKVLIPLSHELLGTPLNCETTVNQRAWAPADADQDGLPDGWEQAKSLNQGDARDAQMDPDSDGLTNLEEFERGTDPHDADSDDDGIPDAEDPVQDPGRLNLSPDFTPMPVPTNSPLVLLTLILLLGLIAVMYRRA